MPNFEQSPLLAGIRNLDDQPPVQVQNDLLDQLIVAISQYYVHLPLKYSALAVNPVEQLRLLASGRNMSRTNFLRQILGIINGLRDRHTTISLPPPWSGLVAYVPFVVERCFSGGTEQYVVTKQLYGFKEIPLGSVISHWNGVPIRLQVSQLAAESQGANPSAAMDLGLANLTIRPLAYVLMPDEDWATVTYFDASGRIRTVSTPWRFYQMPAVLAAPPASASEGMAVVRGLDHARHIVNQFKKISITSRPSEVVKLDRPLPTLKENALGIRYGTVNTPSGDVGYIRMFSFEVPDVLEFLTVCEEILRELPQDRLILDVRDNPGGQIPAGQKLIRMLTSRETISPSPVAFRNTTETQHLGALSLFEPWRLSLNLQYATGQGFSQTLPLTTYDGVPTYRYPGKIALIIDALCYSTTDFFAADFKDNEVGLIVGTDPQTGGGGANVWTWEVLQSMSEATGGSLRPLPGGFGLNISMRRSVRTGTRAGIPVEDLGVEADVLYRPSLIDTLGGNRELLDFTAAQIQ